jgi:hypothetical protein
VAGFERGLLGIRIIARRNVMALAAGQAHRSVPVPGLVAREGNVDRHPLASEGNHQVTVDIGQPARRDCAGRLGSVPAGAPSYGTRGTHGLPYGTAWTALTTWPSEASPGKPARVTNRANSGPFI